MKKNQKGFSIFEGLLLLVIIGLLGFVGWYVFDSNKKTDKTLNQAEASSNSTPQTSKPECKTTSSNIACLTYGGAPKVTFTVPDGWKVLDVFWYGSTGNLIVMRENGIYKAGQKAVIEDSQGGWDGWSPFDASVGEVTSGEDNGDLYKCQTHYSYDSKASFKTEEFVGTKFVKTITKDESGYADSRSKGKYYLYFLPFKSQDKNLCLSFTYVQFTGQPDQLEVVEAAIQSAAKYE